MRVARWVLAIGAWIICAAALAAFSLDRTAAARDALLRATRPAPGLPSPAPPSPSTGAPVTLRTPGGSIFAGCEHGQVRVRYLSPAPGFRIESADRTPGPESHVTFKADGREVRATVRCTGGEPRVSY
jgi:hypothetical protein